MSAADLRWPALSQSLQSQGFPPLTPPPARADGCTLLSADATTSLQATLQALLTQRARHAKLLPKLSERVAGESRRADAAEEALASAQARVMEAERRAEASEEGVRREQGQRGAEQAQWETQRVRLEAALAGQQQKLEAASRRREAVEAHLAEARAALDAAQTKETQRCQRNEKLFVDLHHRKLHQRSALDRRVLDVMDMYEARLAAVAAELRRVQAEKRHLVEREMGPPGDDAGPGRAQAAARETEKATAEESEAASLDACRREARLAQAHAARLAKQLDETREQLVAAQLELGARPSLNVWRSAQRALKRTKTDLINTQLELKSVASAQEHRRGEHSDWPSAILDGHGADTHAMQSDPEYYGLHIYKLKHAAPDALRRRLAALCRLQRVSPDRLVDETKKCLRQADAVPEMQEYIATVTTACGTARRVLGGGGNEERSAFKPSAAAAAGVPDWTAPDTISALASALTETLDELGGLRLALDGVTKALARTSAAPLDSSASLSQIPAAVESLASAYLSLKRTSRQWEEAEHALAAETSGHGRDRQGATRLLLHITSMLGVSKAAAIIPALTRLQGQYAEAVAALKTLQDTLVPGQRLRSPTAIMRAVLGEVKSQSKRQSTTEPLQQLSRLLAVPAVEVVSTTKSLLEEHASYAKYFPLFQRWTDAVFSATRQQSMQAVLNFLGSQVRLEDGEPSETKRSPSQPGIAPARPSVIRNSPSSADFSVESVPYESEAKAETPAAARAVLREQPLGSPFQVFLTDDETSDEVSAKKSGSLSADDATGVGASFEVLATESPYREESVGEAQLSSETDSDAEHEGRATEVELSLLADDVSALDESELLPLDEVAGALDASFSSSGWDLSEVGSGDSREDGNEARSSFLMEVEMSAVAAKPSPPMSLEAKGISAATPRLHGVKTEERPAVAAKWTDGLRQGSPFEKSGLQASGSADVMPTIANAPVAGVTPAVVQTTDAVVTETTDMASSSQRACNTMSEAARAPATSTAPAGLPDAHTLQEASHLEEHGSVYIAPKVPKQPQRAAIASALQRLNLHGRSTVSADAVPFTVFTDDADDVPDTLGSFKPFTKTQAPSQGQQKESGKPAPLTPNRMADQRRPGSLATM